METLVEIQKLAKSFGPIRAVDGVSFKVGRGEVLGFLGPNGAGKSTTMKMITCYLPPTGGTAKVCGHDIRSAPMAVRRHIGYLPEGAPAYPDMTPHGFLKFVADVRGFSGADRGKRIDRVVEMVGLEGVLHQSIETLSKGFKRRVGLAQSLLHDPDVLILDEPTDGLDPNQKHEVRALIKAMADKKSIILSTHILEEVDAVCTRAIIIAKGRVIVDGRPDELVEKAAGHNTVRLTAPQADVARIKEALERHDDVQEVREEACPLGGQGALAVRPRKGKAILPTVSALARDNGWKLGELRCDRGRLDEVFRDLTMEAGAKS